jgi:biopolymer transport protein ExbD
MKFPRNARISRGQLDAAPFAGVVFCLLIFLLLASLVYTPGVPINLPESVNELPGVDGPAVAVALDANGQLYFQNQIIVATNLQKRLAEEVARQREPVTLVVQADKAVTQEQMLQLRDLAANAGIKQMSQQVLPRVFDAPANNP